MAEREDLRVVRQGVVNLQWSNMFPKAVLVNGKTLKSDHRPLCVDTESGAQPAQSYSRPRCFEARWLNEETVHEIV